MGQLEPVAAGVYAWLSDRADSGHPNAGVVVEGDGATVIDTLTGGEPTIEFTEAIAGLDVVVRRVVVTSSHIEYSGGTRAFSAASVHGSEQASALLDQDPAPHVYRAMFPDIAVRFPDDMRTRPVTHIVAQPVQLTPAVAAIPMSGHQHQNLVVAVPGAGVVFAGAMASFGVVPLGFEMYPGAWIDSLETIRPMGDLIIPGHGQPGADPELNDFSTYLNACDTGAAHGWAEHPGAHWDPVNRERSRLLRSGVDEVPTILLDMLGLG